MLSLERVPHAESDFQSRPAADITKRTSLAVNGYLWKPPRHDHEPCLTGQLRGEQAADLRSLLDISALIPLLELRLIPATRTRLQKISFADLSVRLCGRSVRNHRADPRVLCRVVAA
jgi:hypothetical protein